MKPEKKKRSSLRQRLLYCGRDALGNLPRKEDTTYCCGFFVDRHSPHLKAAKEIQIIVHWLNLLAKETGDENILKAGVYLADRYTLKHRNILGERILSNELEVIKANYDIHYNIEEMHKLVLFSKERNHVHIPKVLQAFLDSHETSFQITQWLNELIDVTNDDRIIKAAVYVADKFLKGHQKTIGEIELFQQLEQYKESHGVQKNKENIALLKQFSAENDTIVVPDIIKQFLFQSQFLIFSARCDC